MLTLYYHPLMPACRFVRLMLGEYEAKAELVLERPWERRPDFMALNPAGEVPVLIENEGAALCGAGVIMEYLDETRGYTRSERRLLPNHPEMRAEVRRLVDWFLHKFHEEVAQYFVHERILKLEIPAARGGGAPDSAILRAARSNLRHHLRYIGYLAETRNWLGGDTLSYADLAAAAELSAIDYLGEVPWEENEAVKAWYARVKSRPSFRPLLADKVAGLPPSAVYGDLDF